MESVRKTSVLLPSTALAKERSADQGPSCPVGPDVIYGDDDRRDVWQAGDKDRERARATFTLVNPSNLRTNGETTELVTSGLNLCPTEPFADQRSLGFCSAWYVGDGIVITAGHCISKGQEGKVKLVADFAIDEEGEGTPKQVPTSAVYDVKKVVYSVIDRSTGEDWAIILLDREPEGVTPFSVSQGDVVEGDPLTMVGYPSGLPVKVAAGANVREAGGAGYFVANLDAYGGNSGSVVVNRETGVAEGILVRGATDYRRGPGGCRESNRVGNSEGRGEDVTKAKAFRDELEEVRSGQTPSTPTLRPDGGMDPALLTRAVMAKVWWMIQDVSNTFGPAEPDAIDVHSVNQRELAEMLPLFRRVARQTEGLAGQRFVGAMELTEAVSAAVEEELARLVDELAASDTPLTLETLARIADRDARMVILLAALELYSPSALGVE